MRVAARDILSGKVGTTKSWVEIPDLSARKLTLSSIVAGERSPTQTEVPAASGLFSKQVPLNIARRFRRDSFLRCLVFVYNAARKQPDRTSDVAIQVQVLRHNRPVITTAVKTITTQAGQDQERLPYATEVSLQGLTSGRYVLSITAIDRAAKTSVSEQLRFEIL